MGASYSMYAFGRRYARALLLRALRCFRASPCNTEKSVHVECDHEGGISGVTRVVVDGAHYDLRARTCSWQEIGKGSYGVVYRLGGRDHGLALKWVQTDNEKQARGECIDTRSMFPADMGVLRSQPLTIATHKNPKNDLTLRSLLSYVTKHVHKHPMDDVYTCFCVSELCRYDMCTHLAKTSPTDAQIIMYARDVMKATLALKSRRLCHTDIKMSNVLITHDDRALLGDVGSICDVAESRGNPCTFPSEKMCLHDPNLTSYEYSDADAVWSLTVLLVEMCYTLSRAKTQRRALYDDLRYENLQKYAGHPEGRMIKLHEHCRDCITYLPMHTRTRSLLQACTRMMTNNTCNVYHLRTHAID
ncbi:hypothetical protein CYMTET_4210 [Cymbomonas tetramitiformis]|uniref:Protein kinase domain-containing protein n=1 Tax=Cymbomonas tetramitiformis TaxID=36881 RepID=A0AAE0LKM3_9CHLO|nr:hypothetical protein CYMTET_4210 [Cymbomonas tetramitiformis]